MRNTKCRSVVISEMKRRRREEGESDIGKGRQVAFSIFVAVLLKLVAVAQIFAILISITI